MVFQPNHHYFTIMEDGHAMIVVHAQLRLVVHHHGLSFAFGFAWGRCASRPGVEMEVKWSS